MFWQREAAPGKVWSSLRETSDSFRKTAIQPVFITHYPEVIKPLAKKSQTVPGATDSFQLIAATYELSNAYSELNDPGGSLWRERDVKSRM